MQGICRTLAAGIGIACGLLLASMSHADPCTDGVDCYCDRASDPSLLLCEDFEAPTLHDDTGLGSGAPGYGPWYDDTGYSGARGANSYWRKTYGSSVGGCAWRKGQPAAPQVGSSCNYDTCFPGEWRADDRWGANSHACIDIVRNGEFDDEVASLQEPTAPGGRNGVFDGAQSMAHRIAPGRRSGILGSVRFDAQRSIGATMALAYPTNSGSANLWDYPWKHNEWRTVAEGRLDGPFVFHNEGSLMENDPFQMFMFLHRSSSQAACEAALGAARVNRGRAWCNDVALYYRADPNHYQRSRDFPFGTWGCAQAYFQDLGSSSTSIQVWFNGTLIVDIAGLDSSFLSARDGYSGFSFNSYANRNQTADLSTETTYRYEDNLHVRAGEPVSCEAIGFGDGGTSPPQPPAAPVLLP